MIYPIVTYGNPLLRTKSDNVQKGSKLNIKQLVDDMFETMHKAEGLGLSAIQVGIPLNVFVIEAHNEDVGINFRGTFINPVILKEWGPKINYTEGCLSLPYLTASVERNEYIEIEWYDENWIKHLEQFSGMEARIIQHEYDHLQGNLFIDKLNKMWKSALEDPIELIKNNQIEVPYLIKNAVDKPTKS